MAHDVFISYSTKDKKVARSICAAIEAVDVHCWIAPRDIDYGDKNWPSKILEGIEAARIFLLIISENSNRSSHVRNELQHAHSEDRYIIPVDLDNIPPAKGLKYFLGSCQWFPASNPMELEQLEELVQAIKRAIGRFDDAPVDDSGQRQAVARTEIDDAIQRPPPPQQSKAWLGWVFATLIVAAVAVFGFWKPFWRSADPGGNGNSPDTSAVVAYDDTSMTRLVTGDPPAGVVDESPSEVVTPPATGTFSITSTPDKASIWLNNQLIGRTPHRNHEITAGRYDIKLSKEGYRTATKELIVEAGTSTSLEVALNRFTASLQVKTTPDGVE
ncbi:MAG: TIR domain-containing protein, partial [bacterium]